MKKLLLIIILIMLSYIIYKLCIINYINKYNIPETECRKSTINNPFANYIITSKNSNPSIGACKNLNIKDNYKNNLYRDSKYTFKRYIFSKDYLDNNFITMPVTKYPNDLKKFGDFLYNNKSWLECKTDKYCLPWSDIRFINRYIKKN